MSPTRPAARRTNIAAAQGVLRSVDAEERIAWVSKALCRTTDPDELFVRGAAQRKAAVICRHCPVMQECGADAPGQPGRVRGLGRHDRAAAPRAAQAATPRWCPGRTSSTRGETAAPGDRRRRPPAVRDYGTVTPDPGPFSGRLPGST
ncbi:WhiB4 [Mycobacterium avium subsp. paratuberculosis S5]|nr:WhiB4 [Mycobacterium avium subsp. paratuberculosis S5]